MKKVIAVLMRPFVIRPKGARLGTVQRYLSTCLTGEGSSPDISLSDSLFPASKVARQSPLFDRWSHRGRLLIFKCRTHCPYTLTNKAKNGYFTGFL